MTINKIPSDTQWSDLASRIQAKADSSSLAAVATSGSYNDLTNFPIGWFTMTTTNISGTAANFTSPRGHTYTAVTVNAGSGFKVTAGAGSIKKVKGYTSFVLTGATSAASNLSMHGLASNTTVYARSTGGISGGSAVTPAQTTGTVASGTVYASVGLSVGKVTGGAFEYEATRKAGTNNVWEFFITFHANGVASSIDYTVECTAADANTIPAPYAGGTSAFGSAAHCVLEVLEES